MTEDGLTVAASACLFEQPWSRDRMKQHSHGTHFVMRRLGPQALRLAVTWLCSSTNLAPGFFSAMPAQSASAQMMTSASSIILFRDFTVCEAAMRTR